MQIILKKNTHKKKAAIVPIGGRQWGDYWGHEFASKGLVGLSMPYIGKEGLSKLPEEINIEYFENALKWLKEQSGVDPNKIIVMGASRNAELSLILASKFSKLVSGAKAYTPSSVSWSNIGLYNGCLAAGLTCSLCINKVN